MVMRVSKLELFQEYPRISPRTLSSKLFEFGKFLFLLKSLLGIVSPSFFSYPPRSYSIYSRIDESLRLDHEKWGRSEPLKLI